jgi:DNA repair protein RadC
MPQDKLSVQDFASQIKAKYPEYNEYEDSVLVDAILEKYPVYKGQVDYAPKKKEATAGESLVGPSVSTEVETPPNPFFESLKEADRAFARGAAKTPFLSELVGGSNSVVGGILDYANMAYDFARSSGMPGGFNSPLFESITSLEDPNFIEKAADTFAANAEFYRNTRNTNAGITKEEAERGIVGLAQDGKISKSAFLLVSGATEAIPSVALAATTGIGVVAVSAGGNKYREIENNPVYSPSEKLMFATAAGVVEGLAEKMGGADLAAFRKIFSKQASTEAYRQSFIQSVKASDIYKQLAKSGLEEGFEEALVNSFDQMVVGVKEGKPFDVNKLVDDFLIGMTAGGGTIVTANGMSARGSIKNEKARAKKAQQLKELEEKKKEASQEEVNVIDDMINKNISSLRTLIDQDVEFFSKFSTEDQKRIRDIDNALNNIAKKRKLTSDDSQLYLLQTEAVELFVEKDEIESRYRSDEENALIKKATDEQIDEIRNLEAVILDKKQRLEGTESETAANLIKSQIEKLELELNKKKTDIIGTVETKPAAPKETFVPEDEPTPVTIDLEVDKAVQPDRFEDLIEGRVTMKSPSGKQVAGRIIDEGAGKRSLLTDDGDIIELGNIDDLNGKFADELGLAKAEEIVSIDGNNITIRGEQYQNNYSDPLAAINRDEQGNIVSVNLDAANGTKRTFRGNIGDEVAYNIITSQYEQEELEQQLENLAKQDEKINQQLAPAPKTEVAPTPETAPDTKQAPEQEIKAEVAPSTEKESQPEAAPEPEVAAKKEDDESDLDKKREINKELEGRTIPSIRTTGAPLPDLELDIASRLMVRKEIMSGNKAPFYRNEEEFYAKTITGKMNPDEFIQLVTAAIINTEIQKQKVLNGGKETSKSELVSKPLDSIERYRMKNDRVEYFGRREIYPKRVWKAIPINRGSGQYDILSSLKAGGSLSKYTANSSKFTKDQILIDAGLKKEEAPEQEQKVFSKPEQKAQPKKKSIPNKQDIIDAETVSAISLKSESDIEKMKDIGEFGIGIVIEADEKGAKNKKFLEGSNPKTKYGFIGPEYQKNNIQEVKKKIVELVESYNGSINSMSEETRPKDLLIDSRKKAINTIKQYIKSVADDIGVNKILYDTVTIDGVSKVLTFADAIKQMDDSEFSKLKNYTEKDIKEEETIIAGVKLTKEEAEIAKGFVPSAEDLNNFYSFEKGKGVEFTVPNKEWWEVAKKIMNLGSGISIRLDIYEGGYDKNPKRKRTKDAPENVMIYGSDKGAAKGVKDVLDFKYKGLKGIEAVSALEEDYFQNLANPWLKKSVTGKFDPKKVNQVMWGNNGMYGFDLITQAKAFDALSKGKGSKRLVMDGFDADSFSDYATESTLIQDIKDLRKEGLDVVKQYVSAVAKAFNETEENVAKRLGFEALTKDEEVIAVKYPKTEELTGTDAAPSGSYTDQKTQVVNSKQLGPIRFKSSMVAKNKTEEFTLQQRIYEQNEAFSLTGPEKINGPSDVAFLLRHLESATSENMFLVVSTKKGDYKTIWLGTGTQNSAVVDMIQVGGLIDAARFDLKGEEVFVTFIHNHPSGNLKESSGDLNVYRKFSKYIKSVPGVTLLDGIIINLDSGKFATFNDRTSSKPDTKKPENIVPAPVYSFSRKELYEPFSERPAPLLDSIKLAKFLSKLKINNSGKFGHLILDQALIPTYFAFVDPSISAAEWARTIAVDAGRHGRSAILVGPSEDPKVSSTASAVKKMSDTPVIDQASTGVSIFEGSVDYVTIEESTPEFKEKQGYEPPTDEELDYPSRLQSALEKIKGFKWNQVQKEIIKMEEIRSSKVSIGMKGLGKILRELNNDLGGNWVSRKKRGIDTEYIVKARGLANRFMMEADKSAVVDDILELKNGERILKNLRAVRAIIDEKSAALVTDSTFSKLPKETKENILENIGTYMHRSYRFFDDPTYKFKFGSLGKYLNLGKNERNKAVEEEFLVLYNNWINKLINEAGYTREQAIESTLLKATKGDNKGYSKRELLLDESKRNIDNLIKEYTELLDNRKKMRAQGKGTNIPNSAFLEKKDLPVHIRELLGEVKDPIAQMAATGEVLFNIYEKGKMVEMIADGIEDNLKDVYAKEEFNKDFSKLTKPQKKLILDRVSQEPMIISNNKIKERQKATYKQINDPMSPLNTKWVHNDITEIIQSKPIYETDKDGLAGGFWSGYFFALKNLRMVNVILNSPTWGKNVIGTMYFNWANGWFNPTKQAKNIKSMAEGILNGDQKYMDMLTELAENGAIGQSFNVNQIGLSGFSYYFSVTGDKSFYDKYVGKVRNMGKKVIADLGSTYAAIDDFGKMSIYQNERESFAKKLYGDEYANLNDAQQKKVRAQAAERVKDNTPTWGRITKLGKAVQRMPIGDFQGFRFEAFRSTYRIVANVRDDIKTLMSDDTLSDEQKSEYRKDIRRKLTGLGWVGVSGPYAIIKSVSYAYGGILGMLGFDDEEETEQQRKKQAEMFENATVVRPGWLKNHKVWVKSVDDDLKVRVYDYTGFDPYAEVFGFGGYFGILGDAIQPNMAVNLLTSLAKNEDVYGRSISDPSDPAFKRVMDMAKYGGSQFLPSLITSSYRDASRKNEEIERAERYLKLQGLNPKDFNLEKVNVPKETLKLIAQRAFVRDYEYDLVQQFRYAVKGYKRSFDENYLTTDYPEHRKKILDDVREMYYSVVKVAAYKGNTQKMIEVNKIIKTNFDDYEESYILNNLDVSDKFPKEYFD